MVIQFSHSIATERYRSDSIASLRLPDNTVVTDHVGKEAILFQAFKERLGQSDPVNVQFDLVSVMTRVDGLEDLSIPFTHEEIDNVVKEMPSDRASGPDGFNGCFLKSCWHIIEQDFYQLCMDFHADILTLSA